MKENVGRFLVMKVSTVRYKFFNQLVVDDLHDVP